MNNANLIFWREVLEKEDANDIMFWLEFGLNSCRYIGKYYDIFIIRGKDNIIASNKEFFQSYKIAKCYSLHIDELYKINNSSHLIDKEIISIESLEKEIVEILKSEKYVCDNKRGLLQFIQSPNIVNAELELNETIIQKLDINHCLIFTFSDTLNHNSPSSYVTNIENCYVINIEYFVIILDRF